MAYRYRVLNIRIQPDRLEKLPGRNNYKVIRLKRAVIDSEVEANGETYPFRLVVDSRSGLVTISAKNCPVPARTVGEALMKELWKLSGETDYIGLVDGDSKAPVATFKILVGDDQALLGLLHIIRDRGGFEG